MSIETRVKRQTLTDEHGAGVISREAYRIRLAFGNYAIKYPGKEWEGLSEKQAKFRWKDAQNVDYM
jgi:hypothetical protein